MCVVWERQEGKGNNGAGKDRQFEVEGRRAWGRKGQVVSDIMATPASLPLVRQKTAYIGTYVSVPQMEPPTLPAPLRPPTKAATLQEEEVAAQWEEADASCLAWHCGWNAACLLWVPLCLNMEGGGGGGRINI